MFVLLFVFFFFKQKTAYEMRISDWSSDVCSSDLGARLEQLVHPEGRRRGPAESVDAGTIPFEQRQDALRSIGRLRGRRDYPVQEELQPGLPVAKIGRASCRERVCQYV